MAWANAYVFQQLQELPEEKLILTAPNNEWSVGVYEIPSTRSEIAQLAVMCAGFDAQLRELAAEPDGITTYQREGKTIHRARSTFGR
jgi:hypothetical protein